MRRGTIVFIVAALMLAATSAWGQVTYKDVTALDFSKTEDQGKVTVNGTAKFLDRAAGDIRPPATARLRLTEEGNQAATAFLTTSMGLSNYRAIFDFQAQTTAATDAPAAGDGFAFIVQSVGADQVGPGGGGLGYAGAPFAPPNGTMSSGFPYRYSYAVEFNTWASNGLPNAPDTVALDIFGTRTRINQTAFPNMGIMNAGVMRAQIDVIPDGITATFTGGRIPAGQSFVWTTLTAFPWKGFFQAPTTGTPPAPVPLFFGWGAGTGGAAEVVEILNMRLQVPA